MPDQWHRFVHQENIRNFHKELEHESDPVRRNLLTKLIEEEKQQLKQGEATPPNTQKS